MAGIVKPDVRIRKFEEFRSLLGRRNEKLSESVMKSKEADSEATIPDKKQIITNEEFHLRRIKHFRTHADTFSKKLEKLKKNRLEVSDMEKLKPDLIQVLGLVNEILLAYNSK
jgi:hypothetical protein